MTALPIWCNDLPGVTGAQILGAQCLEGWPDRAMDDRLHCLRFCPVTLQELYQIVRHLPLFVLDDEDGPVVMADLRSANLRRPAFDAQGHLRTGYRPAVTRLLPFLAMPAGGLLRLTDARGPADQPRPSELGLQIVQMLNVQQQGMQRLQAAARLLMARGYLRPSDAEGAHSLAGREWQPAPDQPEAAIGPEAGSEGPLALRLLAALEFSQIHRRRPARQQMPMDRLRDRLGRDEVLRQALFIDGGEVIDFTALSGETVPET